MVVDTSVFIEFLRAKDKTKTVLYSISDDVLLHLSSVTLFELMMGATTDEKIRDIKLLTEDMIVLTFDETAAMKASEVFHDLKTKNLMIDFRDIFIGATYVANNLSIKTLNRKHFERIMGLEIA